MSLPTALFLMGPTASGKTALAVEIVRHFPCEIISVDSAMVYRGMNIGTAKPGPDVLSVAPHRLIDIREVVQPYSVAEFRSDALLEMEAITRMGRIPLLVGGTMLYFRGLQQGLSALPSADPGVRQRLSKEALDQGWGSLHARLAKVDPESAARIHPNDPQRIQRALEVYELTSIPMSKFFQTDSHQRLPYQIIKIIVSPSARNILYERIETRFYQMLRLGFIDEVKALHERGDLHLQLPAMRAVGYRQMWHYLDGVLSLENMQQKVITATRQYAKRQLTWLRSEREAVWFDSSTINFISQVLNYLAKNAI